MHLLFFNLSWFCLFIFILFYWCSIIVLIFPPFLPPALPNPTSYNQSSPSSRSMGPPRMLPDLTLALLCPLSPSLSPLVTDSLFFISMSLVLFCSLVCFVDYVPLIGEIIRYFQNIYKRQMDKTKVEEDPGWEVGLAGVAGRVEGGNGDNCTYTTIQKNVMVGHGLPLCGS